MIYVACQQKKCLNKGAPYHFEGGTGTGHPCPVCGRPMREIERPKGA